MAEQTIPQQDTEARHGTGQAADLGGALKLHTSGRLAEAANAYAAVLRQLPDDSPDAFDALHLFGLLRNQQQDFPAARGLLERALQIRRTPKLLLSFALCLQGLGLNKQALPYFDEALLAMPAHVEGQRARAVALFALSRYAEALPGLDLALEARPDQIDLRVTRLFAGGMLCRWLPDEDSTVSTLLADAPPGTAINPFPLTFFTTDPAVQKEWADRRGAAIARRAAKGPRSAAVVSATRDSSRIRVGYLSRDFGNHAVGHIMPELFECHDRARFDIRLLSCGPDDDSAIHRRYAAIEGFTDLHALSRPALEAALRNADLDILVDLQGHTVGHFCDLLSRRLAPLQIDWIGYPGPIGGGFIDYIIADHFIVPDGADRFYSEPVIRLPHCYQPNNRQRPVAEPLDRAAYGLPADAVVFCCFNRPVKIRPSMFAAWMDILQAVPDSVLWLYAPFPETAANLRAAAAAHGIAPERLIFAPAASQPAYLARFQAADLTLDTFPYGSHSTASDSLWAGCPLLTLCGDTFPSRVAGSILGAIGLPQLATFSLDDYKALAIRLGRDPAALAAIRRTLAENRDTMPLFNTPQMTRDVEAAYLEVWSRHRQGLPPHRISLPPSGQ